VLWMFLKKASLIALVIVTVAEVEYRMPRLDHGIETLPSSTADSNSTVAPRFLRDKQRRILLPQKASRPLFSSGVVLHRPNYTVPACLLASREGPWRNDADVIVAPRAASERRPRRILVVGMQSSGVCSINVGFSVFLRFNACPCFNFH